MREVAPAAPALQVPDQAFEFFLPPPGMFVGTHDGSTVLHTRPPDIRLALGTFAFGLLVAAFAYGCLTLAATQNSTTAMMVWTPIVVMISAIAWLGPVVIWFSLARHHSRLPPFLSKDQRTSEYRGRYFDRAVPRTEAVALELLSFQRATGNEYQQHRVLVLRTKSLEETESWLLVVPQTSSRRANDLADATGLPLIERKLPKMKPVLAEGAR